MKKHILSLAMLGGLVAGTLFAEDRKIATAKQDSATRVTVYDEKGSYLFSKSGELVGYTPTTVTIKEGSRNVTYDNKGSYKFSK
jgi:hypothetical protein